MNKRKYAILLLLAAFIIPGCQTAQNKGTGTESVEKADPSLVGKLVDYKTYYSDGSILGEGKALYKSVMGKAVRIKQGKWVQYYKGTNTVKQAEGEYKDDKQTGPWKFFFQENGKVQQEGAYSDGLASGPWTIYYSTGEISWKADFSIVTDKDAQTGEMKQVSRIEGTKTSFYKNGNVWKEEQMHGGSKNGRSQEYYDSGTPKEISMYKDDLRNGAMNEYWPSAKQKTTGYFTIENQIDPKTKQPTGDKIESKTGNWKMFYSNGQLAIEAVFVNNKPEGNWRFFSREGLLMKEGRYRAGKEDGFWTYYDYDNGRRITSMECNVEAGMIGGGISRVYANGVIIGEGNLKRIPVKALFQIYADGKPGEIVDAQNQPDDDAAAKTSSIWTGKWKPIDRNGSWTEFYPGTRTKKFEATYMINKLNGKYIEFFQNGKIKAEGEYQMNKKTGVWTFYNADGSVDTEQSGQYLNDRMFGKN
jgi:antitoxin component YwqK of YwqJK toxin-antitoxin module